MDDYPFPELASDCPSNCHLSSQGRRLRSLSQVPFLRPLQRSRLTPSPQFSRLHSRLHSFRPTPQEHQLRLSSARRTLHLPHRSESTSSQGGQSFGHPLPACPLARSCERGRPGSTFEGPLRLIPHRRFSPALPSSPLHSSSSSAKLLPPSAPHPDLHADLSLLAPFPPISHDLSTPPLPLLLASGLTSPAALINLMGLEADYLEADVDALGAGTWMPAFQRRAFRVALERAREEVG